MPKKAKKWFTPGRTLHWKADDTQSHRRDAALASRRGNALKTGRALQALANVTRDSDTARKAHNDALYFFRLHKRTK